MKNVKLGRKFIAFLLCLIAIIVLGIFNRGEGAMPFIIALYASYVTGNVTQKATAKDQVVQNVTMEADK